MSLWEWIFERRNPGPIGKMDIKRSEFENEAMPRWKQVGFFCIGVLFWGIAVYLFLLPFDKEEVFSQLAILVVYLIIA